MLYIVSATQTKPRPTPSEGPERINLTLRLPRDVNEKLKAMVKRGYGVSDALFLMVRSYMDAERELAALWWEVEKAAAEQGVGVGTILGRLARIALEAQGKRR
jgi:hypothetical protein